MKRMALITGGSGGIGSAICKFLASKDLNIICGFSKKKDTAEAVVEDIRKAGGDAVAMKVDVTESSETLDNISEEIFDRFGSLDILVNCSAINIEAPAPGMDDDAWQKVIDVNLSGAFRLTRSAVKYMIVKKWGRIIHLSSVAAHSGGRGQINYAASKAGLEAMIRVFALELGRKGITVNGIAPGVIETSMTERIVSEYRETLLNNIAAKRLGKPDDVASLAAFLVSEEASYINGQIIKVDGGMNL